MDDLRFPDPQQITWNTAYADCIIQAPQQRVWDVLTDFAGYDTWNSFTYDVDMPVFEVGQYFSFTVNMSPSFKRFQRERVLHIEPPQMLAWAVHYDPNPLLNASRYQVLTPQADGSTFYQTWETFTGACAPLIKVLLMGMINRGFDQCAHDLKAYCEAGS